MTVAETTLIFAGIPLVVVLAVIGLVFAFTSSETPRYRPDLEYNFHPVWYLSPDAETKTGPRTTKDKADGEQGGSHAEW